MAKEYSLDNITVVSNIPNDDGTPNVLSYAEIYDAYQNGTLENGNTIYGGDGMDIISASQVNDNNIKDTDYWKDKYGDEYIKSVTKDTDDTGNDTDDTGNDTDPLDNNQGGSPTISITSVDDLVKTCNDILSLVEDYSATLNSLNTNTEAVRNAWATEDPAARDLYVNSMNYWLNGSNEQVLPAIRDFANYLLEFAEQYKENMSSTI